MKDITVQSNLKALEVGGSGAFGVKKPSAEEEGGSFANTLCEDSGFFFFLVFQFFVQF